MPNMLSHSAFRRRERSLAAVWMMGFVTAGSELPMASSLLAVGLGVSGFSMFGGPEVGALLAWG